ncbi:MAG: hypothetical protein ABI605_13835 [Rhizobacter sp.]
MNTRAACTELQQAVARAARERVLKPPRCGGFQPGAPARQFWQQFAT